MPVTEAEKRKQEREEALKNEKTKQALEKEKQAKLKGEVLKAFEVFDVRQCRTRTGAAHRPCTRSRLLVPSALTPQSRRVPVTIRPVE